MSRSRQIIIQAKHSGYECPPLSEVQACNTQTCPPVHCQVSAWMVWSPCSKSCDSGVKHRKRVVTVQPANGGNKCPSLTESEECNVHNCEWDCKVTSWSSWRPCTESCGKEGTQGRSRIVTLAPSANGKPCPDLHATRSCNRFACPVDCTVGEWTEFSVCSLTCGGEGTRTRTRELLVDAENGGKVCPALVEVRDCTGGPCPIHCEVTPWDTWSECTKSCGSGKHTHRRSITRHAAHGGYVCPPLTETLSCNDQCCPIDCEVGTWGSFHPYQNGGNNLKRTRNVLVSPVCGGTECPAVEELKIFHHPDCNKEHSGDWSECSKTCGADGHRFRYHEYIKCSKGAAIRLHVKFTHRAACNIKQCNTAVEEQQPHKEVYAPEINSNLETSDEMQLVESIGNWVPVTQQDMGIYSLSGDEGHWQKFQQSS